MFRRKPPAERPAAVHQRAGRSFEVASDRTRAGFRIGTGPVELAAPVAPAAAEPDGPQQPEREFVPGIAARMPRKRVSAGALFRDAAGRILVVEPTYKDSWEIPGGIVEGVSRDSPP